MSDISKRLTQLRKNARLSQEEVADKLNVSRQTVSKWETGQSTPDFDKIAPLCKLYNVSTDELFGVEKSSKNSFDPDFESSDEKREEAVKDQKNPPVTASTVIVKSIFKILNIITLIIYLTVSFATHAWYITWVIWLVRSIVKTFIKLILAIFGIYVDDDRGCTSKINSRGLRIFGLIIALICLLSMVGVFGVFFFSPGGMFFGINNGYSDKNVFDEGFDIDFKTLNIDAKAGRVLVKDADVDKMQIAIFSNENKRFDIGKRGDEFNIDVKGNGCRGLACFNYKMTRVEVYLPKDYAEKIKIKNNFGDVEVGEFENAGFEITEDYGKVRVKSAGELKLNNSMGSTEIGKINKRIELDASMGSVDIDELFLSENSKIDASMGSVTIKKTNDIFIDARAEMGSVDVAKNNREAKVELSIDCSMGSVTVGE